MQIDVHWITKKIIVKHPSEKDSSSTRKMDMGIQKKLTTSTKTHLVKFSYVKSVPNIPSTNRLLLERGNQLMHFHRGMMKLPSNASGQTTNLKPHLSNEKETWLFSVYRGLHPTLLCGDCFIINHQCLTTKLSDKKKSQVSEVKVLNSELVWIRMRAPY